MSRWIYFDTPKPTELGFAGSEESGAKDAIGKIAQLVPGPVLGAYGAALGTLPLFSESQQAWVGVGLYVLGIAATAWLVSWQIEGGIRKRRHIVAYSTAFAVWAYSLTGRIVLEPVYHEGLGLLLPIVAGFVLYNLRLPKLEV